MKREKMVGKDSVRHNSGVARNFSRGGSNFIVWIENFRGRGGWDFSSKYLAN